MLPGIAVVGMACRYADSRSPRELWENALAKRQAFRRIPAERLRLEDYATGDGEDPIDCTTAALIEDYQFDRSRFRVSAEAFEATDMAHWLALDVASQAIEDARLSSLPGEVRERTGVYVGNSLTGEFSRANLMRLRWPFVRRTLQAALGQHGLQEADGLVERMEKLFKSPFPATSEESLAGALSNTISGRIANHFDLKGGAYTVDGACSSGLLAVATACSALVAGDVDMAIAGGVDLSIDPLELAGFSSLGALAHETMRAYDERSSGFWPGEGCGMAVLMRIEDALMQGLPVLATVRGWGISSDGSGGITRPELSGQLLALQRAYQRAGYGIETVGYFEGHGTGTVVGDSTELAALTAARTRTKSATMPAVLSTSKTNMGHTKAAAGIAGLIRAVTAVHTQVLPPLAGFDRPRAALTDPRAGVRVLHQAELWPPDVPLRAGVSSMGFGGINVHVTLEAERTFRRSALTARELSQIATEQDCELFLFEASDVAELQAKITRLRDFSRGLSCAELTDLAVACAHGLRQDSPNARLRVALVAASASELDSGLIALGDLIQSEVTGRLNLRAGVLLGAGNQPPRIGFLFPGQGSPVYADWGIWARRFSFLRSLGEDCALPSQASVATEVAQPAICSASLAGLRTLDHLGIEGCLAVGHSLGELTAYHWAGAMDSSTLLELARARGRAMAELPALEGAMACIRAELCFVDQLTEQYDLEIAAYNSPGQTVVSGRADMVDKLLKRARDLGVSGARLAVSHAFHSRMVDPAAKTLRAVLQNMPIGSLHRSVSSTVTGDALDGDADLSGLMISQVTSPVRFQDAITTAAPNVDLFIEVGPGEVLTGLGKECVSAPIIALDSGGASLRGLLLASGAAFVLGAPLRHEALFADRFSRPFNFDWKRRFFRNPCESALASRPVAEENLADRAQTDELAPPDGSAVDVLRHLIAHRIQLPVEQVKSDARFLADLHLNSIAVSQIVLEAAKTIAVPPPTAPAEYSNVSIAEAALALEDLRRNRESVALAQELEGVAAWTRMARVDWVPAETFKHHAQDTGSKWDVIANEQDPLRDALIAAFRGYPGAGVVCSVLPAPPYQTGEFLLRSLQTVAALRPDRLILVLQDNPPAAAFARSVWLEHPETAMAVVHVPAGHARAAPWAVSEAANAGRFVECSYDASGLRREPRLELLPPIEQLSRPALSPSDLLLVSGGGKGIAAECALGLARNSGCRMVLLGRSSPELDSALASNLARFAAAGIEFRYEQADISAGGQVEAALRRIPSSWGPISAVLHGAGANTPKPIEDLAPQDLFQTLAPKITGLENILSNIDPERLTTLVTFGSFIARSGMPGEADYAFANAALGQMVEAWQASHPHCSCLNLEWSVWAGTGMGQRLGVIDSLKHRGIHPITVDEGVRFLQAALQHRDLPASTVVTSRFARQATLRMKETETPLLRFLEEMRVDFPGVECVADAEVSLGNDPYLEDHVLDGEYLFPAVMGLEAMAHVARAVSGSPLTPRFLNVRFDRPIVVSRNKPLRIRIAALQTAPGRVSVTIRSAETSFQADHFGAECIFDDRALGTAPLLPARRELVEGVNPSSDLYGNILFHKGRFQRVHLYRCVRAHESVAEIRPASADNWFGRHLPQDLLLGDPAARDAAIHSVQVCVPSTTLVPISVESITLDSTWPAEAAEVRASERESHDGVYVYDLEVVDQDNRLRERWEGIRYRGVSSGKQPRLTSTLLVPHLERGFEELLDNRTIRIAIDGQPAGIPWNDRMHRPDGRPELPERDALKMSVSHAGALTFAIVSNAAAGCDVEPARERPRDEWKGLLGAKGWDLAASIAEAAQEPVYVAATRVWAARESLLKAGAPAGETLLLDAVRTGGWVNFRAGSMKGACCVVSVAAHESPLVFAAMLENSPVHASTPGREFAGNGVQSDDLRRDLSNVPLVQQIPWVAT
jgi:enediyne polyketide synthase